MKMNNSVSAHEKTNEKANSAKAATKTQAMRLRSREEGRTYGESRKKNPEALVQTIAFATGIKG